MAKEHRLDSLRLVWLRAFVECERQGSFTAAAQQLNCRQPHVSRHIKNLEEWFGAQLFDRAGVAATLTDEGEAFLARAKSILFLLEDACPRAELVSRLSREGDLHGPPILDGGASSLQPKEKGNSPGSLKAGSSASRQAGIKGSRASSDKGTPLAQSAAPQSRQG